MSDQEEKKSQENNEQADSNEKVMPFLDHLEELRRRLLISIASVFILSLGCYFFSRQIMAILLRPFPHGEKLIFLSPTEGFMIYIKISLFAGLILSLPVLFYQLWKFVSPGLYQKERTYSIRIVFFSTFFFLVGALFCYLLVIPYGLNFLLSFADDQIVPTIQIKEYLKFVTLLIFVFGIVFELPLLSFFLTKLGLVTPQLLRTKRRYGIVAIFIAAAVLTPTTDIVSQLLLAIPLMILYEISIWVSKFALPKTDNKENDT
jgi:sec-independent protein translocase protein TatC